MFLGKYKPQNYNGSWCSMGDYFQLKDSDFPEVKYENSPVKVRVTVEDEEVKYKQKIVVGKVLSPSIGSLPCVIGACKVYHEYCYMVKLNGTTTLAREGDVIAEKENGEWCVLSKFNEERN